MQEVTNELQRHYGQLLGVESPWSVAGVKLELEHKRVEIALERTIAEAVRLAIDTASAIADLARAGGAPGRGFVRARK